MSADGTTEEELPVSASYDLRFLAGATAQTAYVYDWDGLNPSDPNRTDTIYAINLSGGQAPLRLIPYADPISSLFAFGVSSEGTRVSGWAQAADGTYDRGFTVRFPSP